jgi:hypothetical protein
MITDTSVVISQHRLVQPYRALLALCWVLPPLIFLFALWRAQPTVFAWVDVRLALPLLLLCLPALYVWHEGIDVRSDGVMRRMLLPRFFRDKDLAQCEETHKGVWRVWDVNQTVALEWHSAHLTQHERLVDELCEKIKSHADG